VVTGDINLSKFLSKRTRFMRASEIRELLKWATEPGVISFGGGMPDPRYFPYDDIREITDYVIREKGDKAFQYTKTEGVDELKEEILKFMSRRGTKVDNINQILVTSGSQQALEILARIFMDPGDLVVVELPTYLAAIQAFRVYKPTFIGIPMDDNGMRTDILEEKLKKIYSEGKSIKLVYTVPTCQNPAGITMSNDRRKHLLELASKYDFLIIEDDPYSYFLFEDIDYRSIKSMDTEGRVIYLSTFSKILIPGLRLGWAAASEEIIAKMALAKQAIDLCSPAFCQYIAAEALKRGVVDKQLPILKKVYKHKRDLMLEALEKYFPEGCRWTRPVGGMFIFVYLPEKIDTTKMLEKAKEKKVAYVPGRSFFVDGSGWNTMRLNFTFVVEDKIEEGVRRLASIIKEELVA